MILARVDYSMLTINYMEHNGVVVIRNRRARSVQFPHSSLAEFQEYIPSPSFIRILETRKI